MSLGQNIRILRNKKGYSIMKVKELTGLSKSTISELETDKTSPTAETLQKIAHALEIPVEDFFKDQSLSQNICDNLVTKFTSVNETRLQDSNLVNSIPEEFSDPKDARTYIKMHKIFSSNGIDSDILTNIEILEFANALLEQMKMVSYKYKR